MPIMLDDLQKGLAAPAVKTYSPKFFSDKLTGKGGSSAGFLSSRNNPPAVAKNLTTDRSHYKMDRKRSIHNGATTIYTIPVNPVEASLWEDINSWNRPDITDMVKIGEYKNSKKSGMKDELYVWMKVTAMTLTETVTTSYYTGQTTTSKSFTPCYQIFFYHVYNPSANICDQVFDANNLYYRSDSFMQKFTSNPISDWNNDFGPDLLNAKWIVDNKAFMDYMMKFDLYDSAAALSEEWQTTIDKTLEQFFTEMDIKYPKGSQHRQDAVNAVEEEVRYVMNYNIPLELYKNIYASVTKHFNADEAREICKQNLNLLLSNTLNNLNASKQSLITFHAPANVTPPASLGKLSAEQAAAVKSEEPLILVQAGAGTGKSTLILGRIDYLIACGIPAEDITVLSFTNAAADHITEKNPNVHSMTIARMIHEIYTNNFKGHELSSLNTIENSLDIYYPQIGSKPRDPVVDEFERRIHAMIKNDANNFTEMNNFVEAHYDDVMKILDTIQQTSLELEIIICYQKIDTLVEPADITSKFLIIDEVQDNSIFEFVYTLKYIDKHKESMFIVGKTEIAHVKPY